MLTFLLGWIRAIVLVLYHRIIGDVRITTTYTNNDYSKIYNARNRKNEKCSFMINCREVRHVVFYLGWKPLRSTYYTYIVNVVRIAGDIGINNNAATYPRFGGFFRRAKYPHTQAINAHLDNIDV